MASGKACSTAPTPRAVAMTIDRRRMLKAGGFALALMGLASEIVLIDRNGHPRRHAFGAEDDLAERIHAPIVPAAGGGPGGVWPAAG